MSGKIVLQDGSTKTYDIIRTEDGFAVGANEKRLFTGIDNDSGIMAKVYYYSMAIPFTMFGLHKHYETEAFPMTEVKRIESLK